MKTGIEDIQANGLKVCIDWLSWTLSEPCNLETAVQLMGYAMADFQLLPQGRNGYRSQLRHSVYPISIQYDGQEGMGIHVDVSGSAIQDLVEHYKKSHSVSTPFGEMAYDASSFDSTLFSDMLKHILSLGHITRLDLAVDDIGANYYTLNSLDEKLSNKLYVSKFRKWNKLVEYENGRDILGYTIYMGSRTSSIMLRVYDKQLEQNKKLEKTSKTLINYPWVRWELELKDERSQQAVEALIQGKSINEVTIGILSNYLRIICPDASRNDRCSVDPVWDSFIGNILKLALYQVPQPKTINDTKNWLERQVASSLAAVVIADGGDSAFIHYLLKSGSMRLSNHHRDMIEQFSGGIS
ncbi:MAG: replication initiation factor domain-containing protein [Clostridium sp.]|nr:replication initiation factor domain-containing protein [Clostridium sp.]